MRGPIHLFDRCTFMKNKNYYYIFNGCDYLLILYLKEKGKAG